MGDFELLFSFFNEIPLSTQNSHKWDAVFCGVKSGTIQSAYVIITMPVLHESS